MAYIYGNWSNQICATVVGASSSSRSSSSSRRSSSSSKSSSSFQFCYDPPKCPIGYSNDIIGYSLQGCPVYGPCYCVQCSGAISMTKTLSNGPFAGTYSLANNNPPTYAKITGQIGSSSSTTIVSVDNLAYNGFTQRWEIYRTINGVKQIVNYYAIGNATSCPCSGWIDAATGTPALLTFCDQQNSSSNSCGSSCTNLAACPPTFSRTQTGFDLCGCAVYGPCTKVEDPTTSSSQSNSQSSCSPTVLNCSSGTFKYCRPDVPNSCGDENCLCISGSSTSDSSISGISLSLCVEPDPCAAGPNCTTTMRKIDGYDTQGCPIYSAECYKCEEVMPDPNDCPCGCCGDSSSTSGQSRSSTVSGIGLPYNILPMTFASCTAAIKPTCPKDCYPYLITLPDGCQIWKCSCRCIPPVGGTTTTTTTTTPETTTPEPPDPSTGPAGAAIKILGIVNKTKGK